MKIVLRCQFTMALYGAERGERGGERERGKRQRKGGSTTCILEK